jgi:hypothetical protein
VKRDEPDHYREAVTEDRLRKMLRGATNRNADWREAVRQVAGLWKDRCTSDAEETREMLKKRFTGVYQRR